MSKYTVGYVASEARKNGINANTSSNDVHSKLGTAETAAGLTIWDKEDDRTVANGKKFIKEGFGNDGHKGAAFLAKVDGKQSVAGLDFNQLVESGTAHKLAKLEQSNPKAFNDIVNSPIPYKSAADLDIAIDKANAPAAAPVVISKTAPPAAPKAPPPAAKIEVAKHEPVKQEPVKHEPAKPETAKTTPPVAKNEPVVAENKAPATGKPGTKPEDYVSDGPNGGLDGRGSGQANLNKIIDSIDPSGKLKGGVNDVIATLKDLARGDITTIGNTPPIFAKLAETVAGIKPENLSLETLGADGQKLAQQAGAAITEMAANVTNKMSGPG